MIAAILAIVLIGGYFINKSNNADKERLKQAEIAQSQRLEQNKVDEAGTQKRLENQKKEFEVAQKLKVEKEKQDREKIDLDSKKTRDHEIKELSDFKATLNKWMTQDNIASSTARISVATPVTELRKIRDELNNLQISGCLKETKVKLLSAMDDEILMFVYFMQNNIQTSKKIDELKISYLNKLSEVIGEETACKNKVS